VNKEQSSSATWNVRKSPAGSRSPCHDLAEYAREYAAKNRKSLHSGVWELASAGVEIKSSGRPARIGKVSCLLQPMKCVQQPGLSSYTRAAHG